MPLHHVYVIINLRVLLSERHLSIRWYCNDLGSHFRV